LLVDNTLSDKLLLAILNKPPYYLTTAMPSSPADMPIQKINEKNQLQSSQSKNGQTVKVNPEQFGQY
jgi:hypothetical protein